MNALLAEGLTDAIGFVAGALLAFGLARLLGIDPLAPGYDTASIGGIVLLGVGGGVGLQVARRLRARLRARQEG
ncbi:MAG TPA: hypothetical protein VFE82_15405 [Ramlibacter sp.]|jgi:hypothetical protein|uniref:hypothetical protein n=1 Tax=Ramlibacter sp. TaxID=1917967 RepID=UPI002D267AF0|nr:hypothetical protein [Ramlibacter sp.]HZY19859.1 hypothetical protein [Ramlibacter sp.]